MPLTGALVISLPRINALEMLPGAWSPMQLQFAEPLIV